MSEWAMIGLTKATLRAALRPDAGAGAVAAELTRALRRPPAPIVECSWPELARSFVARLEARGLRSAVDKGTIRWAWRADTERLGISRRAAYSTRHTHVTLNHRAGAPEALVRLNTHAARKPRDSYEHYLHFADDWASRCEAQLCLERFLPTDALALPGDQLELF